MAVKRKSILNLDEIVNEKQRAVAYIVSDYAHKFSMTNNDLAGACGLSQSTIANIFRKEAKSMPGPKVLRDLAFGLTLKQYGQIDHEKAKQLYKRLMQAAGYDINAAPFPDHQPENIPSHDDLLAAIVKEKIMANLLGMPFQKMTNPASPAKNGYYDLMIMLKGCSCLDEWNFMISLQPQIPAISTTRFLMCLLAAGYRKTGKYSIVTDSEEVYDILSSYDWSEMELYLSVIMVAEDGGISERYITTAIPYEGLAQAGLTF